MHHMLFLALVNKPLVFVPLTLLIVSFPSLVLHISWDILGSSAQLHPIKYDKEPAYRGFEPPLILPILGKAICVVARTLPGLAVPIGIHG